MAARLDPAFWAEIRKHWEYDPDEPTFLGAARRASEKHGFDVPSKTTIDSRAKREGWERRGNLNGINAAAQRKADLLVESDGSPANSDTGAAKKQDASESARAAIEARDESENKRAEVLARHRQEWLQAAVLRQEALARRHTDAADAFHRLKIAKIAAESTMIQQVGERRAWGMEIVIDPGQLKNMSDEQLEAIVAGKAPK